MIVIGRELMMKLQKLQGDSDTNYGVVFVINKYLRVSAERGSAFGNRMWAKRLNDAFRSIAGFAVRIRTRAWPAVFNL
jgi:alkylhydroperoxidase family enzyme